MGLESAAIMPEANIGFVPLIPGQRPVAATGVKSGYVFAGHSVQSTTTTPACHLAQAYPTTANGVTQTGTRIFVIATEGVLNAGTYTGAAGWGPTPCDIAAGVTPLQN